MHQDARYVELEITLSEESPVACNSLHEMNNAQCVVRSCIKMHATLNLESCAEGRLFMPQNARAH